jgi:aryl-alcohol dehydrogenase-like predicted oxidoreductase
LPPAAPEREREDQEEHQGGDHGRRERLRADCEESLRGLRLDTIDLWQLHEPDRGRHRR